MTIQEASTSTANDSNPNYESKLSATSDIFIGVVMAATVFVSIFGNTVVVCLTWKQRKKLKPMDYMIVNLALTDIGIALLGYPFAVLAAFNHRWNSGDIGCKWYGFIGLFFGASSIICMSCLAFFRYMKICQEHRGAKLTKKKILVSILIIWVISGVWASLPLVGWSSYVPEPFGLSCTVAWVSESPSDVAFIVCLFIFVFFLPLVVVSFSYVSIGWKIWFHLRSLNSTEGNRKKRTCASQIGDKLTKIALGITVSFLVAWSPYAIESMWVAVSGTDIIPTGLSAASAVLAKTSSIYNPLIYYIVNKKFREDANRLVCCCGCMILQLRFNYGPDVMGDMVQNLPSRREVAPPTLPNKQTRRKESLPELPRERVARKSRRVDEVSCTLDAKYLEMSLLFSHCPLPVDSMRNTDLEVATTSRGQPSTTSSMALPKTSFKFVEQCELESIESVS